MMVVFVDYESDTYSKNNYLHGATNDHHLRDHGGDSPIRADPPRSLPAKLMMRTTVPVPVSKSVDVDVDVASCSNDTGTRQDQDGVAAATDEQRDNPNCNSFSAALSCYPYV